MDGWVPIIDPVTGQSSGQLFALVALGTAEQITLLKTSRNLQTTSATSQILHLDKFSDFTNYLQNTPRVHAFNKDERELYFSNSKTQECQTDISTVKESKFNEKSQEKTSNLGHSILQNTVDHLTQVLNVNKIKIDQAIQTEINFEEKQQSNTGQICSNELNFNNSSDDSDNNYLPTETYRSVGVGAEYNEETDQHPESNHSNTTFESSTINHVENESTNSTYNQTMFRAIVEIECALHLPKVEKINETVEPSTYVSFQAIKSDHTKASNSYMITNMFPHSCNPKWNWKCDTALPTELLLHVCNFLNLFIKNLFPFK